MSATSRLLVLIGAVFASASLASGAEPAVATTAPTPPPLKPPTVYTETPTQVSGTSVAFKGTVNAHGLATVYAFQFGTTTGYGAQTAPLPIGNGTTGLSVSQTMAGLTSGATYHCRLVATNSAGTSYGGDVAITLRVPLTLTLTGTPPVLVFGSPLVLRGTVSGTGAADHQVVLQANPFPFLTVFKTVAGPLAADALGGFAFPVAYLNENTQFRVATLDASPVRSAIVLIRVSPRVSLHVRSTGRAGRVRLYGTVAPANSGGRVLFQLMRAGHVARTIAVAPLVRGASESRYGSVVRIRSGGLYRAFVPVASGRQVAGRSRALLIR